MKKGRITKDQFKQLIRLCNDENFDKFSSLCSQYGIGTINMWKLLIVMGSLREDLDTYGITLNTMHIITPNFLFEGVNMADDPAVKSISESYKIEVDKLHEMYAKWYCTEIEVDRWICRRIAGWDELEDGQWFKELRMMIGVDKLKDIFKFMKELDYEE